MTTVTSAQQHSLAQWGLLRDLRDPRQILGSIGPNWYASIMGTGIVANAAATLPVAFPGLRTAATAVWILAALLLVGLTVVWLLQWILRPGTPSRHAADPVMAQFYGAPPMALLTVGAGTLLLGQAVLGTSAAVAIDWTLWTAGTIAGLASSVVVPYLMFTRHKLSADSVFAGWLMPIVPPMVSAATGALLVPYAPAGQARLTLLLACYAMFGLSLIASVVIITLLWGKLTQHKVGPARMVPTLWIVVGPLGQSITAANLLGGVAHLALPAPYSTGMEVLGLLYGLPVWGFALLWAALAAAITISAVRAHLPFSLTWWSFTFPVGTLVTGTSGLAAHSHADLFIWAAALFYAGLVAAWSIVAVRTAHESLRGRIFAPASSARPEAH
jgi:C4-dicarboxylate transporter/malic acid transport protein